MLMRPAADGKKLFLWREVSVDIDFSLLPDESVRKSLCPGGEGSAMIFPADFSVLEACRSWRDGRLQPNPLSRANDMLQSALVLGSVTRW